MQRSYLDYAMSVIVGRALPDVRDGLKPVHRKILYAMYDSGYRPDRGYVKCARAIGDVVPGAAPSSEHVIDVKVVGLLGDPVRASRLFHSGWHPTLRLMTVDGAVLTGTANHPVLCRVGDALRWKLLGELRPGDLVAGAGGCLGGRGRPAKISTGRAGACLSGCR